MYIVFFVILLVNLKAKSIDSCYNVIIYKHKDPSSDLILCRNLILSEVVLIL